jgi:hypothetical protein
VHPTQLRNWRVWHDLLTYPLRSHRIERLMRRQALKARLYNVLTSTLDNQIFSAINAISTFSGD